MSIQHRVWRAASEWKNTRTQATRPKLREQFRGSGLRSKQLDFKKLQRILTVALVWMGSLWGYRLGCWTLAFLGKITDHFLSLRGDGLG